MKKLRKIWALALLAAGFALVLGCSNGSSGSGSGSGGGAGGSGGGQTSGGDNGTGTGSGTGDQTVSGVVTVFDPGVTEISKWQSDENKGELVSGTDGNKYLKVKTKSWNDAMFYIEGVNLTGKTKVSVIAYVDEDNSDDTPQVCVDLIANEDSWVNISNVRMNPIVIEPKTVAGNFDDNESKTNVCSMIKVYALNASYTGAVDDVVVYIGKITAE